MPVTRRKFLERVCGADAKGWVRVCAIHPEGSQPVVNKLYNHLDDVEKFVDEHKEKYNIYFTPCRFDKGGFKKENALSTRVFHVDLDDMDYPGTNPDEQRDTLLSQLAAFDLKPTFTIFTGGGVHAYWVLEDAYEKDALPLVESVNYGLAKKLGGDSCHDITRLLRMPGTTNLPNARKRSKGRVPTEVPLPEEVGPTYPQSMLEGYKYDIPEYEKQEFDGGEEDRPPVPDKLYNALDHDNYLCGLWYGDEAVYKEDGSIDRSDTDYKLAACLYDHGYNDSEIAGALFGYEFGKASDRGWKYVSRLLSKIIKKDHEPDPTVEYDFDTEVRSVIERNFPHWGDVTEAAMSVVCALAFKDQQHCITMMISGRSSGGKTTVAGFCRPKDEKIGRLVVRADDFTPKAFVSHISGKTQKQLEKQDLLPQLDGKVLLTGEMSPIFRGSEDQLVDNFKIIAPVLDGRGMVSGSGVHGLRGYDRKIVFNWIGCTTPLPPVANKVMANLGTRIVFYRLEADYDVEEDLVDFFMSNDKSSKKEQCNEACTGFLKKFFTRHPPRTFDKTQVKKSYEATRKIVKLAKLLTFLRGETFAYDDRGGDKDHKTPQFEAPYRVLEYLEDIVTANALIRNDAEIGDHQVKLVKHLVMSSVPEDRRLCFEGLIKLGGLCSRKEVAKATGVSKKTAGNKFEELIQCGLVEEGTIPSKHQQKIFYRLKTKYHELFGLNGVPELEVCTEDEDEAYDGADIVDLYANK